jgi:hypothetical protein
MLTNVVALVWNGVGSFGLGVVSEVFGYDRTADGLPATTSPWRPSGRA